MGKSIGYGLLLLVIGGIAAYNVYGLLQHNIFEARYLNFLTLLLMGYLSLYLLLGGLLLAQTYYIVKGHTQDFFTSASQIINWTSLLIISQSLVYFGKEDCYICEVNRLPHAQCSMLSFLKYWQLPHPYTHDNSHVTTSLLQGGIFSCFDGISIPMSDPRLWMIVVGHLALLLCLGMFLKWSAGKAMR